MKKKELKRRLWLTMQFTLVVSAIMFLTIMLVGVVVHLLIRAGMIEGPNNGTPSPTTIILIVLASNFCVGVIITLLFSRIPLKPVNIMINKLNALAQGDYKTRINVEPKSGIYPVAMELVDSFNKLAEELEHTEVLRADFVNNFSHEFKTPIVSIAGFAKLLKKGNLSAEEQEEYLKVIEEESLRLSYMATNVLNLTKIENQTILTNVGCYNLSEQIRSCIILLETKWSKKNISFAIDFDEYTICAGEELMKQVWINLIDNAVKFSDDNGVIEIVIKQNATETIVSVANRGPMISEENRKRIFNKFYQADESHSREGNGVGLSIVKRVVELHAGKVSVNSDQHRTVFEVALPMLEKYKNPCYTD